MTTQYHLPLWHTEALEWFEANAGKTFASRPFDVGLPIKVTSLQKGIWKPAGTDYALSVVETHRGVYADLPPIDNDDGTWTYFYHQQGQSPAEIKDPTVHYANVGLFQCMVAGIPVGVVIPALDGNGYQVLGLAYVESHDQSGYFKLLGPVSMSATPNIIAADGDATVTSALLSADFGVFDPNAEADAPIKVLREITRRHGAPRFRKALIYAYRGKCAMTGYDAADALEAAHIIPYKGPQTNHPTNGLLLRADMHTLFDLGLVAVKSASMTLELAPELTGTKYEPFHDRKLWLPPDLEARPNLDALDRHYEGSRVA